MMRKRNKLIFKKWVLKFHIQYYSILVIIISFSFQHCQQPLIMKQLNIHSGFKITNLMLHSFWLVSGLFLTNLCGWWFSGLQNVCDYFNNQRVWLQHFSSQRLALTCDKSNNFLTKTTLDMEAMICMDKLQTILILLQVQMYQLENK